MDAASAGDPSASTSDEDGHTRDNADDARSPADAERDPENASDGATGARDAGTQSTAADACSAETCVSVGDKCDDDHPCSAGDSVCTQGACQPDPGAPASTWQRTPWSGRVGLVGEDDTTLWCTPTLLASAQNAGGPARVTSELQRVALAGSQQRAVTSAQTAQRIRFQCFADAALSGPSTVITSPWSVDGDADVVSAGCPRERPYAAFMRCQLAADGKPPFVYAGPSCGDGASGLSEKPSLRGQLIGDHYELSTPDKPLLNNTSKAAVIGTDLGYQFLAQGRMYIGFGDTWENESSDVGPNGYRGSILAYTHDFAATDQDGIRFEGWETSSEHPDVAREIVPSPHDQSGNTEFTAIATSGFGLSEGSAHYRVVWFASIKSWDPYVNNEATLAWSKDGGSFTRGDKAPDVHPPRWPYETHFGPAAIWVDREHGYLYFFGVRTYQAGFPIRLARVRATLANVLDHLQYEYWTGHAWQHPDAKDEYALARVADPAADLIPGNAQQNNRPEFSVAYNPYLGRFIMIVHNDATPFNNEAQTYLQLWQAERPEGPWQLVDTGENLVLPPAHYGPYMSEQTQGDGGHEVAFTLSEWNLLPLFLGQPYAVGLWNMRLERRVKAGCVP